MSDQQFHLLYPEEFADAHAEAGGAVMGARMAGRDIPVWTGDTHDAFREAVAEVFNAGVRLGIERGGQ